MTPKHQTKPMKLKLQPLHRKPVKVAPEVINARARQFRPEAALCLMVSPLFLPAIFSAISTSTFFRVAWRMKRRLQPRAPVCHSYLSTVKWPRRREANTPTSAIFALENKGSSTLRPPRWCVVMAAISLSSMMINFPLRAKRRGKVEVIDCRLLP